MTTKISLTHSIVPSWLKFDTSSLNRVSHPLNLLVSSRNFVLIENIISCMSMSYDFEFNHSIFYIFKDIEFLVVCISKHVEY